MRALFLSLFLLVQIQAHQVITWDSVADESVQIVAYHIYIGHSSRNYDCEHPIRVANATSASLDLGSGPWYVAVTAISADGLESAFSNEIIIGATGQPEPPQNLRIIGQPSGKRL